LRGPSAVSSPGSSIKRKGERMVNPSKTRTSSIIAFLCLFGFNAEAGEVLVRGAVLSPGQTVEATTDNGKVRISYVSSVKRKYEWDEKERLVKMIPRPEPFQGKLGLYNPAASWGLNPGGTRLVVQESVINFHSEAEVSAFLRQSSDYMKWVFN